VEHGARYSTVPILLLDAALIIAADAYALRWWPRPRAIAAVAALIAVLAAEPAARVADHDREASYDEPAAQAWHRDRDHPASFQRARGWAARST
jgi:hypothetical protein